MSLHRKLQNPSLVKSTSQRLCVSRSDKHLTNDPATLVVDSLKGLCLLNPHVRVDEKYKGWITNRFHGMLQI